MSDNDKYIDPSNALEIINKIKSLATLGDVRKLADETFPTWIITLTGKNYCSDYPYLQQNWYKICQMSGASPICIMIVDDYKFDDDNHTVVKAFSECFTRAGFSVRRKKEYNPCENCGRVVPTQQLWHFLKQINMKVPEKWSPKCIGC